METARYTGSFVPGEKFVVGEEFGGQAKLFFSVWAENWAQMASGPGMFRNIMVFMICTMGAIVELREGRADFTTSGMGMCFWNKPFRLYLKFRAGLPSAGIMYKIIYLFIYLLVSLHAKWWKKKVSLIEECIFRARKVLSNTNE